ncbi:hypothetical protein CJ030_MR7G000815 [Morella rubra]|uniref:Uncharacterized protein n=1 Tax=Morella rubra TaxID=262757 RepID=A0A6A1V5S9_9ROSI|nr:hypothetical protein CJ030_MR7G000815 [Morella rubra]
MLERNLRKLGRPLIKDLRSLIQDRDQKDRLDLGNSTHLQATRNKPSQVARLKSTKQ